MRYIIYILLTALSGCAKLPENGAILEQNIPTSLSPPTASSDNTWKDPSRGPNLIGTILEQNIPASLSPSMAPSDNTWTDPSSWGSNLISIDYSNKILFKDDTRIHEVHKIRLPDFAERYVLWRAKHDGSCWVTSSTTLLFYHMIESGQERYNNILTQMKDLAKNYGNSTDVFNKEFFDIFELIKTNFSHKFVLNLRNHQAIYEKLDQGMRMLLAAYKKSQNLTDDSSMKRILKIQQPHSWGYAIDFYGFFQSMGIECPVIDIGKTNDNKYKSLVCNSALTNPPPKMIIIHSKQTFIDIIVDKEFSFSLSI